MQTDDEILWIIARKRASFKKQLISYVLVCSFLWAVWFLSGRQTGHFYNPADHLYNYDYSFPWPIWVMFWWGIALVYCFVNAYVVNTKDPIRREYEKLKNQQ